MYLNYNGSGGKFGDTSIGASVGNGEIANASVYASLDSTNPNRMVVMAINRTTSAKTAAISLNYDRVFDHAEVYQLTSASTNPVRVTDIRPTALNALDYTMPAYSVTTLVFVADGLPGDFNHDGKVDVIDLPIWQSTFGQTGNQAADANEDGVVDAADYTLWRDNLGRSDVGGAGSAAVAEPSCGVLLCVGAVILTGLARTRRSRTIGVRWGLPM
jgi:hypothetical protein